MAVNVAEAYTQVFSLNVCFSIDLWLQSEAAGLRTRMLLNLYDKILWDEKSSFRERAASHNETIQQPCSRLSSSA